MKEKLRSSAKCVQTFNSASINTRQLKMDTLSKENTRDRVLRARIEA